MEWCIWKDVEVVMAYYKVYILIWCLLNIKQVCCLTTVFSGVELHTQTEVLMKTETKK
jgi:hypothetical protein